MNKDWSVFKSPWDRRVSYSKLSAVSNCPRAYHMQHELKIKVPPSEALVLGGVWDDLLYGVQAETVEDWVLVRLNKWRAKFGPAPEKSRLQVPFEKSISGTKLWLYGFIDELSDDAVIDYKFALKPWTNDKAESDSTLRQLRSYAWALDKPRWEIRVANKLTDEIQHFKGDVTRQDVDDTLAWMIEAINVLLSKNRDGRVNWLCERFCSFNSDCPAFIESQTTLHV